MTASTHPDPEKLEAGAGTPPLSSLLEGIVGRRDPVGLMAAVVRLGARPSFAARGFADVATQAAMTKHTGIRVASVTKTFTAIAVMQLVEEGSIGLDDPVDARLTAYRLRKSDPQFGDTTIRHLLTHTGGLGEIGNTRRMFKPDFGESFPLGTAPSLAEFYGGSLEVVSDPGSRWIYNNHGPSTLGQIVEDVRGKPLRVCFREHIFEPLGMVDTDLERSVNVEARLASGYEPGRRGMKQVPDRDMVTTGAAGVYSTASDMARYLGALIGGGRNEHGSILRGETLQTMFAPHHQPDPRIPGTGLGFWRSDLAGHGLIGHQGTIPGFHGQILVSPRDRIGVLLFTNGGAKADFWVPLEARHILAAEMGVDPTPSPSSSRHPEVWHDIAGFYRLDASLTDIRLRGMLGAGAEVIVRHGTPILRFQTPMPDLLRGFPLVSDDPDDPYSFRLDLTDDGLTMRAVFSQDIGGVTDRLHLDLVPITLEKQPPARNPRTLAAGAVGGLLSLVAGTGILLRLRRD